MPSAPSVAEGFGRRPAWQKLALCAEVDPAAFYPAQGQSATQARRICRRCDVAPQCLAWAIEHNEVFGVWGGLTRPERQRLAERQRRQTKTDRKAA